MTQRCGVEYMHRTHHACTVSKYDNGFTLLMFVYSHTHSLQDSKKRQISEDDKKKRIVKVGAGLGMGVVVGVGGSWCGWVLVWVLWLVWGCWCGVGSLSCHAQMLCLIRLLSRSLSRSLFRSLFACVCVCE